jgi:hypothetical protein
MKLQVLASLALGAAVVQAACPGGCNGHGACGAADVCECQQNWAGGDCSLRACPFGPSWTATTMATLADDRIADDVIAATPGGFFERNGDGDFLFPETFEALYPKAPASHAYTECSGRGTCDYSTGLCRCFEGFEGRGCRRMTCPNGCSGHGRCLTNSEINDNYNSVNGPNDEYWDQHRTQSCACDRGYSGYDCSLRICPFGDDPTTACSENSAADYQMVQVAVTDNSTFFTLEFTDMFGGAFTTRPIAVDACEVDAAGGCRELQYALMELPNFAIPEVEVDLVDIETQDVSGTATTVNTYVVHFSDPSNTGKQNTLQCEVIADNTAAGAAPKYANVVECATYNVGQPEWYDDAGNELTLESSIAGIDITYAMDDLIPDCTSGALCAETAYEEFVLCSNKGLCDYATGNCVCSEGHFGEACEKQSTFY